MTRRKNKKARAALVWHQCPMTYMTICAWGRDAAAFAMPGRRLSNSSSIMSALLHRFSFAGKLTILAIFGDFWQYLGI
jgi:hypothetical protein